MLAARASASTSSQPLCTTGANAITSTLSAMNWRSARSWFAWLSCATSNRNMMLLVAAADLMDSEFARRQSFASPSWLNPRTIRWSDSFLAQPAAISRAHDHASVASLRRAVSMTSLLQNGGLMQGESARNDEQRIHQREPERRQVYFEFVTGLQSDTVGEAQG